MNSPEPPAATRNPFVGPRPLRAGEALPGRDREVRELFDLLHARRIVVLHAPSVRRAVRQSNHRQPGQQRC